MCVLSSSVSYWCQGVVFGWEVDWEGIVVEDVLNGSNFCVVVVFLQVVSV